MPSPTPTDEVPPLQVGGRFQWANLPVYAKLIAGAIAVFVTAVMPVVNYVRTQNAEAKAALAVAADKRAAQAKDSAEAGFQDVRRDLEALKAWKHQQEERELRDAALKRRDQPRRPLPVVTIPPPKPLPTSLNAALEGSKSAPPQQSQRAVDSGVQ